MSILDRFRLDGKTALVTGARRGLGKAMALALAEAGADIVATSASLTEDGGELGAEIRSLGRSFHAFAADLSDRQAVYRLVAHVLSHCPPIDILVNNAGAVLRKPAHEYPDEDWDKILEVNLNAQFVLAREFGRRMLERGAGKIIFTASVLSFQGGITVPSYAAAKGGLAQLTKALANEWAGKNVQVNAIAPGYMATDNTKPLREDPDRNAAILARIPAGRWGVPADLAGAVVYLASPASDYVNGTLLTVDGGWMGR
jgi:2-deoxy-D-gluconate 3-dehydrogenase